MQLIVHHVKDQLKKVRGQRAKVRGQRAEGRGQGYRIYIKACQESSSCDVFFLLSSISVGSTLGEDELCCD